MAGARANDRARWRSRALSLAVLCVGATAALTARAQPQDLPEDLAEEVQGQFEPPSAAPTGPSGLGEQSRWRQILASPRIGGRLTALAVDWDDPRRLYVGTEESTVLMSDDGGVTWQERPLSPFVVQLRSVGSQYIPLTGRYRPPVFSFYVPFEYRNFVDPDPLIVPDFSFEARGIPGSGVSIPLSSFPVRDDTVSNVLTPRSQEVFPVQRITLCPQSRYPLMVATVREVFGSDDNGTTFVRLYGSTSSSSFLDAGQPQINDVDCSPTNPNDIVISTSRGIIRSLNGGLSFTENVRGASAGAATAAAFDLAGAQSGGPVALLVAHDSLLFIGDPDSPQGLQYVYPDFDSPICAPYFSIRWIITTESAQIWLATDFGVRGSIDGGQSWFYPERNLFGSEPTVGVDYGTSVGTHERVAIATRDRVYATDDSGQTWFPFFYGLSRRSIQYVASGPPGPDGHGRWYVITSGEVWATEEPPHTVAQEDPATRAWAVQHLHATPSMGVALDDAFNNLSLGEPDIDGLLTAQRGARGAPYIEARLSGVDARTAVALDQRISFPLMQDSDRHVAGFAFFVQATFDLPDLFYAPQASRWRGELIELRKQVGYVVEDAWNERELHLTRLARGQSDPLETEMLRARVEVLETVLETWTGQDYGQDFRAR